MKPNLSIPRLEIVDWLRGFAALAVCWYHFTQGVGDFLPDGIIKDSGIHGYLGVPVFFVISGFIIPYTMRRGGYRIRDYFRFLGKRIIRIDPPYFISIAMVLVVGFVLMHMTNHKRGVPPFTSWQQLASHAGYLNALLGYKWLNPAYWSLAVEFQYYLLIGILFPLLIGLVPLLLLSLACCGAAYWVPHHDLVFSYLPWFLFGVVVFNYKSGSLTYRGLFGFVIALACNALYFHGALCVFVLCATALLIAFCNAPKVRIFGFLGAISYSIYLTHVPVGVTLINLSKHFQPGYFAKAMVMLLALVCTIVASYLLYRWVELPSLRLSSRIRYRDKAATSSTSCA